MKTHPGNLDSQSWGRIDYDVAMRRQDEAHRLRVAGESPDSIFVLEHPPVVTRGRKLQDVFFAGQTALEQAGVQVRNADRGGELTYHGPGQIVVYFVMSVTPRFTGIADLVLQIENVLIDFVANLGVPAHVRPDHPGLWVGQKKIASIGLRVAKGITKHGLALNVQNDLAVYRHFQPCGLSGDTMTTIADLTHRTFLPDEYLSLQSQLLDAFMQRFSSLML